MGKGTPFKIFDEDETANYLSMIEGEERRGGQPKPEADPQPPSGEEPAAPDQPWQDPQASVAMDTE